VPLPPLTNVVGSVNVDWHLFCSTESFASLRAFYNAELSELGRQFKATNGLCGRSRVSWDSGG